MKKFSLILLVFGLMILMFSAGQPLKLHAGETINIGIVLPLTGRQEAIGSMEKQAYELALEKTNQAGAPGRAQLQLVFIDSAGNPVKAVTAVKKALAENGENLRLLAGGCNSAATWTVAEYAQQQHIPFLINTASSSRITAQGWDYVFRLNPPEEEYLLEPIARLIKNSGEYQTVAIIYENSICMTESARKLKQLCGRLNLDLSIWNSYQPGRKNFRRLAAQMAEKRPDILLLVGNQNEAAAILSQCQKLEIPPELIIGCSPTFSRQELWDAAGGNAAGVYTTALWKEFFPYAGAQKFSLDYNLNFAKSPDYHAAEAYAGLEVITDVFSRAQTYTRDEIKNLLAATDMMTVFGPVKFISDNRYTNQNRLIGRLLRWHEGSLEMVDN